MAHEDHTTDTTADPHATAGVEPEGIQAKPIILITVVTVILMAVIVVVGLQIALREYRVAETVAVQTTGYPVLRRTQADANQKLSQYRVLDAESGRYVIPLDRAIDLLVNEASLSPTQSATAELTLSR